MVISILIASAGIACIWIQYVEIQTLRNDIYNISVDKDILLSKVKELEEELANATPKIQQ
jgi:hypothetical protein